MTCALLFGGIAAASLGMLIAAYDYTQLALLESGYASAGDAGLAGRLRAEMNAGIAVAAAGAAAAAWRYPARLWKRR